MNRTDVERHVGQYVTILHRGGAVSGKLVKVSGQTAYIEPVVKNGKKVKTNAVLPLALFDLLAIGTSPFAFGGFGPGFGFGSGFGFGFPGFFW